MTPALNLGIAEQGPSWGKAQCQKSGRVKGTVTWSLGNRQTMATWPQWEKAGDLDANPGAVWAAEQGHGHTSTPSFNMV